MHHHHGKANGFKRWDEHRGLEESIWNTDRLGQPDPHTTMRNSGFGGDLSHHDQQASRVAYIVVGSDASSSEEASMDSWWAGNASGHSYSSDRERPSPMPELSQMLPPSPQ
jgi:hypothetical protein